MLRNPFGEKERWLGSKKKGRQESVTEGLPERREQRGGGDAEGEPRQRTEEAEAHFLGALSPIHAVSRRHMKTTGPFHLHFVTDDIKEIG